MEIGYEADVPMSGKLFLPEQARRKPGAVLIFPEAPGPGDNVMSRASRLAAMGYATMVADLHGDGTLLTNPADVMDRLQALRQRPALVLQRGMAALSALHTVSDVGEVKVAAIGYCFGGTIALDMGRNNARLAAIIGLHCGLLPLCGVAGWNAAPVLACIGADDPTVTVEHRLQFEQEMRDRGGEWTLQLYGNVIHAFTDRNADRIGRPDFARYDAWADAQSWHSMVQLLDRVLLTG